MTATHWLLLGLIILCAMCLVAIFFGHCINTDWRNADEPIYRTADSGVLSADARAALCAANAPMSAPKACQPVNPNLQTTHRQGTAAALRDMGRKPGTPPTPNPHGAGTLAHFAWRAAYERTSTVCNGGALS